MITKRVHVLREDDGRILVAPSPGPADRDAIAFASIPALGAELGVDVSEGDPVLRAEVFDVDAAAWWLRFAFGPAVAAAVDELAAAGSAGERAVDAEETEFALALRRLLVGLWLKRWLAVPAGAAPIDEWLLDAELGALAWETEEALDGVALARRFLAGVDAVRALAYGIEGITALPQLDPEADQVARVVVRAARACLDVADLDATADLAALLERFDAQQRELAGLVEEVASWTAEDVLLVAAAGAPEGRRGLPVPVETPATEERSAGGELVVDWRHVHPRSIDPEPGAARWSIVERDGAKLFLAEAGAGRATVVEADDLLYIRGRDASGNRFGVALDLDAAHRVYRGEVELDPALDAGSVTAELVSAQLADAASERSDAATAAGVRAAVERIVRSRAEAIAEGSAPAWLGPFAFEAVPEPPARGRGR